MDELKYSFKKLSNDNYENWKYKMELYLMKKGLWQIVSKPKPEQVDNAWTENYITAKAIIGLSVDDSQYAYYRSKNT